MEYSLTGEHLTEQFESCRLTSYQDSRGRWTIGWGHTGPEIGPGMFWNQSQCDAQLLLDIQWAVQCINKAVTVTLTQSEFDALVDFVFNVGSGNFGGSTLLRLLNAGDMEGAAAEFDRWDKAGGQVVAGLLRRRQAEAAEFDANGTIPTEGT
jgi:lysozyme